jgi:N-methylhydantoinase B
MGGEPGRTAAIEINGSPINHIGRYSLAPGDQLTIRNAGGGGYGASADRDKALKAVDLANGYVTTEGSHA